MLAKWAHGSPKNVPLRLLIWYKFTLWIVFFLLDQHDGETHDDVIKWKHFPRHWPFVRGIHRSPVNSPHKGQWRRALMFSVICVWTNAWTNHREAETSSRSLWRHCNQYTCFMPFHLRLCLVVEYRAMLFDAINSFQNSTIFRGTASKGDIWVVFCEFKVRFHCRPVYNDTFNCTITLKLYMGQMSF